MKLFDIEVQGYAAFGKYITLLKTKLKNPISVYKVSKVIMLADVLKHFREGKGPEAKWAPLSPATLARRRKKGTGAKPLRDEGHLEGSITAISSNSGAEVGTNKRYAVMQNFGAKKGKHGNDSKGHPIPWGNVPARRFMWLSQDAGKRIVDRFIMDIKQG